MKRIAVTALAAAVLSAGLFAEAKTVYISPNNDGVQDFLEIPLRIKEKRYIKSWSLNIENEKGELVRTIGNKESRPSRITFKSFFKSLLKPKTGVTVPSSVSWNGILDNSTVAPDGLYRYWFTASDDNDNTASTEKMVVIVDNTPPEIELKQPSQDNKIFGEGAKAQFKVTQDGSTEDLWTGTFTDVAGNTVFTKRFTQSAPVTFSWDGVDDNGAPVADGVYTYKITATDRAGNTSEPASITNIIYSAEKPATNITINGSRYFSPKEGSSLGTMKFDVKIPVPESAASTGNKLTAWKVEILGTNGKVYKSFSGDDKTPPPDSIVFDGKGDNGAISPDGTYQARVTAKYLNGYEPDPVNSPVFTLDTKAPESVVKASSTIFSPDGDGNLDSLTISQKIALPSETEAPVQNWKGVIAAKDGTVVREYDFGEFPPESIVWDGLDAKFALAANGEYSYTLSATDAAGNSSTVQTTPFSIDTSKTELLLSTALAAFNPAGDSAHNTQRFTPVVNAGANIKHYKLTVADAKNKPVYIDEADHALPKTFAWNGIANNGDASGTRCQDGVYTATLATVAENGTEASASTQKFIIDSVAPSIEVSVPYTLFSPESTSSKQVLPVTAKSSNEDLWTGNVLDASGKVVKAYTWKGTVPSFDWDGTDDAGNKVANGTYRLTFASEDAAGNKASAEIGKITVDSREVKAYVSTELDAFSPNGDGVKDTQQFAIRTTVTDGIESWKFDIVNVDGTVTRSWSSADSANLPATVIWEGLDKDGKVAEGAFTAKLSIVYTKGNAVDVTSSAFISTATPPQLTVRTATESGPNGYFSPDNDGEDDDLYIQLKAQSLVGLKSWSFQINDPNNGKKFWGTSGKNAITERMIWDGRGNNGELVQSATDYPYVFTVTDELGMTNTVTGEINVDILVIRVGDLLKMAVPSIIFRSDNADFELESKVGKGGLTEEQAKNNERVLKRIAVVLNKFKNYTVTVEGHANNVSGTQDEETTNKYGRALMPLSQERAEFVMGQLKKYGVSGNRLSAVGRGGTQPVAAREDRDNWWKNRRVEFILNKN
ncbi:MAG: OmpA family protein [Treponema sp.]|nr:OmpA family protein [Treponema sp.]